MSQKTINILILIFICVNLLACATRDDGRETEFLNLYKHCEMNDSIKISFQQIRFDTNVNVNVYIQNLTDKNFLLSYASGVEMWQYIDKSWLEVKDSVDTINLGADSITVYGHDYKVVPVNPYAKTGEKIRIVVTGKLSANNSIDDGCVGAFSDYVITP